MKAESEGGAEGRGKTALSPHSETSTRSSPADQAESPILTGSPAPMPDFLRRREGGFHTWEELEVFVEARGRQNQTDCLTRSREH